MRHRWKLFRPPSEANANHKDPTKPHIIGSKPAVRQLVCLISLIPRAKQTKQAKQTQLPQPGERLLAFAAFLSLSSPFLPLRHHSDTHRCCVTFPLFDAPVLSVQQLMCQGVKVFADIKRALRGD